MCVVFFEELALCESVRSRCQSPILKSIQCCNSGHSGVFLCKKQHPRKTVVGLKKKEKEKRSLLKCYVIRDECQSIKLNLQRRETSYIWSAEKTLWRRLCPRTEIHTQVCSAVLIRTLHLLLFTVDSRTKTLTPTLNHDQFTANLNHAGGNDD